MNLPPDQAERARITARLGRTTVVVAGAGSGKTRHLVERVCAELANGTQARQIAVITFTERAARELAHRIRERANDQAIDQPIDDAFIGTIHGFCARILRRFPIEAELTPGFRTLTDDGTLGASASAPPVLRALLDASTDRPDVAEAITHLLRLGRFDSIAPLSDLVAAQWDRFSDIDTSSPPPVDYRAHLDRTLAGLREVTNNPWITDPANTDKAAAQVRDEVIPWMAQVQAIDDLTQPLPDFSFDNRAGSSKQWSERVGISLKELRERIKQVKATLEGAGNGGLSRYRDDAMLRRLLPLIVEHARGEAQARIARGEVNFEDLLVLTHRLLQTHPTVRASLRRQYRQLYVDEFQDTDPVQYAIVNLLCDPGDDDDDPPTTLFAVGDPKQSIYAFRNAEPALFRELIDSHQPHPSERVESDAPREHDAGSAVVSLTTNFRTQQQILGWINTVIARRFDDDEQDVQARYEDLVAVHPPIDAGPGVVVLGAAELDADERDSMPADVREATEIAAVIRDAIRRDTTDSDTTPTARPWLLPDSEDGPRAPRYEDVAVLVRTRGALGALEAAFDDAGIPYRVEGGISLYDHREAYELLRVLRALARPEDPHAAVTALRTNILAVSDLDLYRHRLAGGSWLRPSAPAAHHVTTPVDDALGRLQEWRAKQAQMGVAELITHIYDETLGVAAAVWADGRAHPEAWRRARFLIDEARSWQDTTAGTLEEYLEWIDHRRDSATRVDLSSDERDDAVRILTIHAAKGLEYPIVIVAGLGRQDPRGDLTRVEVVGRHIEAKIGKLSTINFPDDRADAATNAALAEESRLMYVAFTRAKHHLVVSLHRGGGESCATRLIDATGGDWGDAVVWTAEDPGSAHDDPDASDPHASDRDDALRQLLDALDTDSSAPPAPRTAVPLPLARRRVVTPSAIASTIARAHATDPGLAKDPRDSGEPARSFGRYGTSVGTAVHEVLQLFPAVRVAGQLDEWSDEIARRSRSAAARAGLRGHREVEQLARSILVCDAWSEMVAAARHRREIYVGAQLGPAHDPLVVQGYVDAVWDDGGELVLADFKTDALTGEPDALIERYRFQMSGYAAILARSTGLRVARAILIVGDRNGEPAHVLPVEVLSADELVAAVRAAERRLPQST